MPGCNEPKLRMGKSKAGALVTVRLLIVIRSNLKPMSAQDNSNFVIDAPFDGEHMRDPHSLLAKIKMLTGESLTVLDCSG